MTDMNRLFRIVAGVPLLLAFTLTALPAARGALLFYDGFDYAVGDELGESTSASNADWENDKSNITIAEGSLAYVGLADSTGHSVEVDGGSSNLDGTRTRTDAWASQSSGSLFVSFLLRLDNTADIATSGDGTPLMNISRTGSGSKQLISVNLVNDAGVRIGVLKYPSSSSPVSSAFFSSGAGAGLSANGSTTYLVVARYEWVAGAANDVVTLWVDPGNLGAVEDPSNKVFTSAGTDGTENAGRLYINRGPHLRIDELRIGQTWAEVTPSGAAPSQPVITEAVREAQEIVLRGTNGAPGSPFLVMAGKDLALPLYAWAPLSTNTFDPTGGFDTTNATVSGSGDGYYLLLLGDEAPAGPTAPVILSGPNDAEVLEGSAASFSVAANGTSPLFYQWYFNTHTPIPGATGTTYGIASVSTNDAGAYHAMVSNSVGAATSSVAVLSVLAPPLTGSPDGYATVNGGTTGGAGGATVTVDNFTDFEFYVDNDDAPYIVLVQGTINLGGSNVRVRDNKTIVGVGTGATLVGNLKVFRNSNVIIQNITFTNPNGVGDGDGLTVDACEHLWVDHCTFVDCDDGSLDITHGSDWITVSWCRFYYTDPGNSHRFCNLVGHSDNNAGEDAGKLHVTFHHNLWGDLVHERMPRVRFGRVHCFNNYYNCANNNYCLRAALECEALMEANYFGANVDQPWEYYHDPDQTPGKIYEAGNAFDPTVTGRIPATDTLTPDPNGLNPPPYPYTPDAAGDVPAMISDGAGAGRGPFAP